VAPPEETLVALAGLGVHHLVNLGGLAMRAMGFALPNLALKELVRH
jgi:hypothetical protein